MEETIISGISVIFAFIGLYFVIRIWAKWRYIDKEVLKARVFLNKKFLERNWLYIFLSGSTLTIHQFLGVLIRLNYSEGWSIMLYSILEFIVILFLVVLAYEWSTLIYKK